MTYLPHSFVSDNLRKLHMRGVVCEELIMVYFLQRNLSNYLRIDTQSLRRGAGFYSQGNEGKSLTD